MTLKLYAHPFSSYCQKVLIALYENSTRFDYLTLDDAKNGVALEALWPIKKFPVLVDEGRTIMEASIIIEHLDLHHPGPARLIPENSGAALEVRLMDRFFDNYVMTPMQKIVADRIRPEEDRDPYGVREARAMLDKAYDWLDRTLANREWAVGATFSLADCAAAPSLFYADWAHPISEKFSRTRDYRRMLLARPSFARAVDEARPYRPYFPLGAPDRD
ncbi:glutathione S-transferase family protein [Microvirga sp. CF3062]|uniref:glutathione S-transferase family protein n=1 Tax=Microvirga sp. CF3062 TaxID=3110182 RepID=UPI002E7A4092|nr:glutathione S-transferase family protein [Microvirga sp. CF3062]MEE1658220.1 glutathione S-transferase family protein [Microvirga sp. CF3062]